jgi:hypothetical protein
LGRFWQIDPLSDAFDNQSPYQFASNNPILINDPLGLGNDTLPNIVIVAPLKPAPKNAFTNIPWEVPGTISPNPPSIPTPTPTPNPTPTPTPTPEPVVGGALLGPGVLTTVFALIPQSTGDLDPNWLDRYRVFNPYPGHANRTENWDPHIVYQISFSPTDQKTPILKYGISDALRYGTDRPESQVPALMARWGSSVKVLILRKTLSRGEALAVEQELVNQHVLTWHGAMPREQKRPTPSF